MGGFCCEIMVLIMIKLHKPTPTDLIIIVDRSTFNLEQTVHLYLQNPARLQDLQCDTDRQPSAVVNSKSLTELAAAYIPHSDGGRADN